ncbi:MAG: MFS transporter, partial [Bryobacterales bacterium]|nr:MFS transporter [Bryobacterales bacterium]
MKLAAPNLSGSSYRWELVFWLWCAFFLNQADRQVYSVVLPQLRTELQLSDIEAGLVATLFSLALALCVPVAGWAGDRLDRRRIVLVSLAGWSLSTLLTGFSTGLVFLVLIRSAATGAGEAFYAPAAYALMAAHHAETRSRAMSVHQTAL